MFVDLTNLQRTNDLVQGQKFQCSVSENFNSLEKISLISQSLDWMHFWSFYCVLFWKQVAESVYMNDVIEAFSVVVVSFCSGSTHFSPTDLSAWRLMKCCDLPLRSTLAPHEALSSRHYPLYIYKSPNGCHFKLFPSLVEMNSSYCHCIQRYNL